MASRSAIRLWPLPLTIAITLVLATHLAWALSLHAGHVPACIPYLEGCTSISRAARHGLGNHLFRLLMLPCALLVGVHWWLAARWLGLRGRVKGGLAVLALGAGAAVALAVYVTFLGSEGDVYRFLRRYGVVVFFGCSYLAQLLFLRHGAAAMGYGMRRMLAGICLAMLALGLVHVAFAAAAGGTPVQDRLEDALEWNLGVLLVAWYLAHARLWWRDGYVLTPATRAP